MTSLVLKQQSCFHFSWLISLYDYFRNEPQLIIKGKGFEQAGIIDAINLEFETEDPSEDLL